MASPRPWSQIVAAQPPDEEHAYGHTKAEYFSSALEGGLILLAALAIGGLGFRVVFIAGLEEKAFPLMAR
mgnify:CR=1 FL=1